MEKKEAKCRVSRYIERRSEDIVDWLRRYIGQPSEWPNELDAQKWVRRQFAQMGTFDKVDFWPADKQGKRPNVVGVIAGKSPRLGKKLIFNGHGDVAPVTEEQRKRWSMDPWKGAVERGRVYGRGANDMKGGIASMLWAAKAIRDVGLDVANDLIVEVVVAEEECQGLGINSTIDRGYRAPFAVVPEPTGCEVSPVSVGNFDYRLTAYGKDCCNFVRNLLLYPQKYGTPVGPEVGVDAFEKMLKLIDAFRMLEKQWAMRWRDRLAGIGAQGIGQPSIAISLIRGGTYFSSVPGSCEIVGEVYYPSWVTGSKIIAEMKLVLKHVSAIDDWLAKHPPRLEAPLTFHVKPLRVPLNHQGCKALADAYTQVVGKPPTFSTFGTVCDASWFTAKGIPAVIFGPGGYWMGTHGVDEFVPVGDVIKCCKTLAMMAIDWCSLER